MPKMKNKNRGEKALPHATGTGKVRANVACKRHNLRKRSKKMKRQARGTVNSSRPRGTAPRQTVLPLRRLIDGTR